MARRLVHAVTVHPPCAPLYLCPRGALHWWPLARRRHFHTGHPPAPVQCRRPPRRHCGSSQRRAALVPCGAPGGRPVTDSKRKGGGEDRWRRRSQWRRRHCPPATRQASAALSLGGLSIGGPPAGHRQPTSPAGWQAAAGKYKTRGGGAAAHGDGRQASKAGKCRHRWDRDARQIGRAHV